LIPYYIFGGITGGIVSNNNPAAVKIIIKDKIKIILISYCLAACSLSLRIILQPYNQPLTIKQKLIRPYKIIKTIFIISKKPTTKSYLPFIIP
jgi:hypothetical protein